MLESELEESSELIKSQGGVFEIEDRGDLIFSKRRSGRFPHQTEILDIIRAVEAGQSLKEAQLKAGEKAPKSISFFEWLANMAKGR